MSADPTSPVDVVVLAAHAVRSFLVLGFVFGLLEWAFCARAQPFVREGFVVHAIFFFGQYLVWSSLAAALLRLLRPLLGSTPLSGGLDALPMAAQIVVVVAGDVVVSFFHRACHALPLLWRFHRVHHSSTRLDGLAAHREHPVDGVLTQLAVNLPAFLLGVPLAWVAPVAVARGLWRLVLDSNTRLPLGPLGLLLGDPSLHRLHHRREGPVVNDGNLAPWLDVLLGTHARPEDESFPLGLPRAPDEPDETS